MLKELSPLLKDLESQKRAMLQYMDGLTPAERATQPGPKELSPIQVLAHVVKVEETVFGPDTKPAPGSRVGIKGRIFMAMMVNLMRPGFRIPTTPLLHPKSPDNYEDLKLNWEAIRKEMAARLTLISENTRNQPVTNHMMAGHLSAPMALDFLNVHLRYHWKNFPRLGK